MSAGIPGAKELMKQIAEEYPHLLTGLSQEERANYGRCMGQLSSAEQRRLLRPHLEKAKINWTHIAIAGMMKANYIARVLTFNFDNVLARACGLAGLYPPTYDFAVAPSETFQHFGHRAVLHLHGQGHGFEMFNSEERTRLHAQRLHPLLTDTFHNFPVLVVGYSGQSDAVFAEMEKIFSGRQRLIWLSYGEDVPSHVEEFLDKGGHTAQFFGGADSDKVLVELARELDCFPDLFEDPYGHLLAELEEVAAHPFPVDGRGDMLNGLRAELTEAQIAKHQRGLSIEDRYRQGDWDAVIEQYDPKNSSEVDFAYWAAINKADAIFEKANAASSVLLLEQAASIYKLATEIRPNRPEAYNNWAVDLAHWARERDDLERIKEAISLYEMALEIDPDQEDTLLNIGTALVYLGKISNDSSIINSAISSIKRAIEMNPARHQAHNTLGNALSELAAAEDSSDFYEDSFRSYKQSLELFPENAVALANWANSLGDLANSNKDRNLLNEASAKYRASVSLVADDALVYNNWGSDLSRFGEDSADRELLEVGIEKFALSANLDPNKFTTWMNFAKALVGLSGLNQDVQTLAQSFDKYRKALALRPNDIRALREWAVAIYRYSNMATDKAALIAAIKSYESFESESGFRSFEIALSWLKIDELGPAKDRLFACKSTGNLPSLEDLEAHEEIQAIREISWFEDLIERLET